MAARSLGGAEPALAGWLVERLKVFRQLILAVNQAVRQLTGELETQAPKVLPKGMGRLTYEAVETEVAAWDRFKNRRQVGSYAGLCGWGGSASGQSSADLSISKAGNRRLRTDLVELDWRTLLYQPNYYLVKKWKAVLLNPRLTPAPANEPSSPLLANCSLTCGAGRRGGRSGACAGGCSVFSPSAASRARLPSERAPLASSSGLTIRSLTTRR